MKPTSDFLVLNFDCLGSPTIKLKAMDKSQSGQSSGWGFGWYPHDDYAASLVKDAMARETGSLLQALTDWTSFRSTIFMCKVKGAAKRYTQHDTQPFSRSFAGYDWLFLHNGDFDMEALRQLHGAGSGFLDPVGKTDSELAFCYLMGKFNHLGARGLSEVPGELLKAWLEELDEVGCADLVLSDGRSLAVYHGKKSERDLFTGRLLPRVIPHVMESETVLLNLDDLRNSLRTVFVITSCPFPDNAMTPMEPGRLLIVRRGSVCWDSQGPESESVPKAPVTAAPPLQIEPAYVSQAPEQALTGGAATPPPQFQTVINIKSQTQGPDGQPLSYRCYDIGHLSEYSYSIPVEQSTHTFRLQPVEDPVQEVVHSVLEISTQGDPLHFEDVFGNQSVHYDIEQPFSQLVIKSQSRIKVYGSPPDDHSPVMRRTQIPLIWMPWQRQMMLPYLLPPELPETQLRQLTDFAMSFVERNDYLLLDTLLDMNRQIYRDFAYVQGITFLETTPFDIFTLRKGVCQDFANLLICLSRLLNVPARYRVGYIYTGGNYENKVQSEASHAWVEVYLPYLGWRGLDPTNGTLAGQDHIRVACGRNYLDATPVSGTLLKGGRGEQIRVDVKIEEVTG